MAGITQQNIYCFMFLVYVCTLIETIVTNPIELLNGKCELTSDKNGTCVYLNDCPSAIKIVYNRGRPKICGFDGLHPIVCCEKTQNVNKLPVGAISLRKCNETYFPLAPNFRRYNSTTWVDRNGSPVGFGYGGRIAASKEFKHMAALGYGEESNIGWLCGGTLISERFVMTAAHCLATQSLGPVKYIRLGDLNLRLTNDTAEPQDFRVGRTFIHPEYAPPAVYNDIALIELDRNAKFTDFVRPACLNTDFIVNPSAIFWKATGWGVTKFGGYQPDHLQEMLLKEYPIEKCREVFQETSKRRLRKGIDEETQLCAGDGTADTCQGDSGGPLQINNYEYLVGYTVIGITSFGRPCGLTKAPGVYTRVSHYVGWIESIVWPEV